MALFRRVSRVYGEEGPTGIADRIMRRVYWLRARFGGNGFAKSWYGPAFRSNINDTTFRFYITGSYGRLYWDELQRISESFVFLDIGANQGLYTLGASLSDILCKQLNRHWFQIGLGIRSSNMIAN